MRYVCKKMWVIIDTADNNQVLGHFQEEHKAKDRTDMLNGLRRKRPGVSKQ